MRKSSAISMAIILVALVGMMVAAEMALKPMKRTLAVGKDVAAALESRGDIRPGSKVVTIARKAEERHLASEGWGMIIELEPSDRILRRKGGLTQLAYRAVRRAASLYGQGKGRALEWFEIRLRQPDGSERRTLIEVGPEGRLTEPVPALPATVALISRP